MNFHYPLISRVLIALLFVVAGVQKIMGFEGFAANLGTMGLPFPAVMAVLVILIEVPVAIAFAWGYKVRITGGILAAFVLATIVVVHKDVLGADMGVALKNLAIIGGILATTGACSCARCEVLPKA